MQLANVKSIVVNVEPIVINWFMQQASVEPIEIKP
jgi:hypothetical protein